MKTSKKIKGLILAGVLSLALVGCGNQAQEAGESSQVQESTGVTNAANEAESISESTQVQEEVQTPPVELAAGFDEEFVLKPGEKLYIGRDDVSISLEKMDYDEYGTSFIYTLSIAGKEIRGFGFAGTQIENQINQDEFTENRVCCIGAEKDKNVTLLITSGTEVPAPLVLSGEAKDEYVTTKPEYVESEEMVLFLCEGAKVYGNTMELLEKLIRIAEKESGLYMENDTSFAQISGNATDWLYGQDVFPGVDKENEKFHVYVVEYDVGSPCALGYGVVLNPMDLEIEAGEGYVMLHETLHCLHNRNGVQMDSIMDEGFTTYLGGRICDKDEELFFNFDATLNYSYYDKEITKENAEEIFLAEKEDNWESYLYGYRFMTFLYETYGEDIFRNILKDASQGGNGSLSLSREETAKYVKKNTADTVFEDFAVWLEKNEARFNP